MPPPLPLPINTHSAPTAIRISDNERIEFTPMDDVQKSELDQANIGDLSPDDSSMMAVLKA